MCTRISDIQSLVILTPSKEKARGVTYETDLIFTRCRFVFKFFNIHIY